MDLLDSILSGMEKPPEVKKPEIKDKDQREKLEKMQKKREDAAQQQKDMLHKFRHNLGNKLRSFIGTPVTTSDEKTFKINLRPMNKIYRTIVHEICEEHEEDIVVHSFGEEEVDRHCIIWKRGYEPCDEEIRSMKLGVEYKPKGDENSDEEESSKSPDEKEDQGSRGKDGKDKFWSKYEKIIGENASGLESARVALPAKQYGCVPIEHKKDQRSIEQMMDDIKKNKRQKVSSNSDDPKTSTQ